MVDEMDTVKSIITAHYKRDKEKTEAEKVAFNTEYKDDVLRSPDSYRDYVKHIICRKVICTQNADKAVKDWLGTQYEILKGRLGMNLSTAQLQNILDDIEWALKRTFLKHHYDQGIEKIRELIR